MSPVEFRRRYRGCLAQGYLAVLAILVQWYNITSVRFPPPPELYIWYPPQVVCACQCLLFSIKFILTIYSLPPMIFQIFSDFYWHPWILQKSKKHQHQHLHQLLPKPEWYCMTIMRPTITPLFFFFSFSPQPCSIDYGPSRVHPVRSPNSTDTPPQVPTRSGFPGANTRDADIEETPEGHASKTTHHKTILLPLPSLVALSNYPLRVTVSKKRWKK